MSNTNENELDRRMQEIFAPLKAMEIAPPPFLKTRLLAHGKESVSMAKGLYFWKLLSGASLAALIFVSAFAYRLFDKSSADAMVQQAYVIQIDFNQADQRTVARAEIELPGDVQFVSKNPKFQNQKKLSLPVAVKNLGRGKLPFVVSSDGLGERRIKIRLLDAQDQLVREEVLKVKFAKQNSTAVF